MEVNIEKMLKQQQSLNAKIANEPMEKEDQSSICYHGIEEVVTKTNTIHYKGEIVLTRYISSHVYQVVFSEDVKVVEILPYYELNDSMFLRCSKRKTY